MGDFLLKQTDIQGLVVIEPKVFYDNRGFFMEIWNQRDFENLGLSMRFVQDNHSKSKKGVLRGMHFQKSKPQGKLVRVISGEVFDVAVDIRMSSPTFKQWRGVLLSAEKKNMFYVPEGFAHGFLVVSEEAEFVYKCTNFYDSADEAGFLWNDPTVGIEWPLLQSGQILLSDKDQRLPAFHQSELG